MTEKRIYELITRDIDGEATLDTMYIRLSPSQVKVVNFMIDHIVSMDWGLISLEPATHPPVYEIED
jgi:hypothetical protein